MTPGDRRRCGRGDVPRRLGEVLSPALDRLATSDQARAYQAWARAVGEPVKKGARPRAFGRGRLTVDCASSVWANELTYLGPQILRRMDEVSPGHPVTGFRFVVGRWSSDQSGPEQENAPAARKIECRREQAAPSAYEEARTEAKGVRDERLRAAIEAALRRSSEEPPGALG